MGNTIKVPMNEVELMTEICYNLTRHGAAYNCVLNGKEWVIEITGY